MPAEHPSRLISEGLLEQTIEHIQSGQRMDEVVDELMKVSPLRTGYLLTAGQSVAFLRASRERVIG